MTDIDIVMKLLEVHLTARKRPSRDVSSNIDALLNTEYENTNPLYTNALLELKQEIDNITNECSIKFVKRKVFNSIMLKKLGLIE